MSATFTSIHPAAATIEALTFVHSADLSPDGGQLVWSRSQIDGDTESIGLYLTTVGVDEPEMLVNLGRSHDPAWSPDGRTIAYLHADDDVTQIHLLDVQTRQTRQLTTLKSGVIGRPRWSPNGALISCTGLPEQRDPAAPFRVTRSVGWLDGLGLVDDVTTNIYVVDIDSGAAKQLTDDEYINDSPQWHEDSERLSYLALGDPLDWKGMARLRAVSLDGIVTELAQVPSIFSIALHGETLLASTAGNCLTTNATLGQLFAIDSDGVVLSRTDELGLDISGDVITDMPVPFADPDPRLVLHGNDVLARVQREGRIEIHRVSTLGVQESRVEMSVVGCLYPLAVRGDKLLFARGDRLNAPDFWVRDLTTGQDTRLTHTATHNSSLLTEIRVTQLQARAANGPAVQATFLAPAESTGPLPTIMLIHGGPEMTFGEAFFSDAQLLCEAGFGVLLVNPRGSRGYGEDYMTAIRGNWGGIDADDFNAALDLAIEQGLADPERLGVAGLSYGGYMTTWLIGQSARFKAAVAENPATNLLSLYGTSDVGLAFVPQLMSGSVGSNTENYLRSSPVSYAEQVTTPTLLIVSEGDRRCPPEQALQFYSRIRSVGCQAEMLVLPGVSHAGSIVGPPAIRRAQNDALVDWMERHLLY